jgi:hypothetical protein
MHTPLFPAFRPRLAALGRRTAQTLRVTLRDFPWNSFQDCLWTTLRGWRNRSWTGEAGDGFRRGIVYTAAVDRGPSGGGALVRGAATALTFLTFSVEGVVPGGRDGC